MASSYVVRISTDNSAGSNLFDSDARFSAMSSHDRVIVVDWISLVFSSTAGGTVTFELKDSGDASDESALLQVLWRFSTTLAAGESASYHINFQGGMPLRRPTLGNGYAEEDLLDGRATQINETQYAATLAAGDAVNGWIGFHLERMANRG